MIFIKLIMSTQIKFNKIIFITYDDVLKNINCIEHRKILDTHHIFPNISPLDQRSPIPFPLIIKTPKKTNL